MSPIYSPSFRRHCSPTNNSQTKQGSDEARSPLLCNRSDFDQNNTKSKADDQADNWFEAPSPQRPTVTSIQYLEDPEHIDRFFLFEENFLGVPHKLKKQLGSQGGWDESRDEHKKRVRAVLRAAVDLRDPESESLKVVKTIDKDKLPASSGGDRLWRRLCHKLLRVTNSHNGLMHITDVLETDTTFHLISEKLEGGELFKFLLLERAVPEELCKYLIKQILHSLDFLHSNGLLHRDVKPENLMFRRARPQFDHTSSPSSLASTTDSLAEQKRRGKTRPMTSLECSQSMSVEELQKQFELAIIDFDTCKMIDIPSEDYREVSNGRRRLVGTYGYLAPEVLRGHEYTVQSDLWSVGVIFYILMTGVPPVPMDLMASARAALGVLQEVKRKGIDFDMPPFPDFCSAQDLCRSLLQFDPNARTASAIEALEHPWLQSTASNQIPHCPFRDTPLDLSSRKAKRPQRNGASPQRNGASPKSAPGKPGLRKNEGTPSGMERRATKETASPSRSPTRRPSGGTATPEMPKSRQRSPMASPTNRRNE